MYLSHNLEYRFNILFETYLISIKIKQNLTM